MSLINKIKNMILIMHPKLVTFGIGLTITFVVGTAIGMVDHNHMAFASSGHGTGLISNFVSGDGNTNIK